MPETTGALEPRSGMGFELTFRLLKNPGEQKPPTWPANLLQVSIFEDGTTQFYKLDYFDL